MGAVEVCRVLGDLRYLCFSLCLQDLLKLLGLLAQLLSWWETLPHLHEERCYLVATQKARCPPLQPVQNAGLHRSCVKKKGKTYLGYNQINNWSM